MSKINCSFEEKCSGFPLKCYYCKRNYGKRDYYVPNLSPVGIMPFPHTAPKLTEENSEL